MHLKSSQKTKCYKTVSFSCFSLFFLLPQTAPGQRGAPGGGGLVELPDTIQTESTGPAPTFNRYRPPSGFMEGRMQMEDMGLDQETMLNVLQ